MGMYDHVDAPDITCTCGAVVYDWQSKDGDCLMLHLSPDDVDNYYSMCDSCGRWHEFQRPPVKNTAPFVHTSRSRYGDDVAEESTK